MATNVELLNAVRSNASENYKSRIPEATAENVKAVGKALNDYQECKNEFLHELICRLALVKVSNKLYSNPLKPFKKGFLEYGDTIEDIFVEIAKAQSYDPAKAENELFKRVIPDVKAIFHKRNRFDFYKTTISDAQLKSAVLNQNGISELTSKIIESLYSGDEYDEFLLMKELMNQYGKAGLFYPVKVDKVTDKVSSEKLAIEMRTMAKTLGFMNSDYNAQGVLTHSSPSDLVIFMTPRTEAVFDVMSLAVAFNMDKADLLSRVVIVDDFGGLENVEALMVDERWFMVYDTQFEMREEYNPQGLYWNYFLHHWQILSTSQFANAIAFLSVDTTVSGVVMSPKSATASKGQEVELKATVSGTGQFSRVVKWEITGAKPVKSIVDNGKVFISPEEENKTLTVTATSIYDTSQSDTATITVSA